MCANTLLKTVAIAWLVASVSIGRTEEPPAPMKPAALPQVPLRTHPINVEGRALDPDGQPIEGAVVFLVSTNSSPNKTLGQTVTDREGRYAFRMAPLPLVAQEKESPFEQGYFQVFGQAEGRAFAWRGMKGILINPPPEWLNAEGKLASDPDDRYLAGEEMKLDLTFPRARPVWGTIRDEAGRGIAGVSVRLANANYLDIEGKERHPNSREFWALGQAAGLMPEQVLATTDAQGRFDLPSVPPELVCWLKISHPDFADMFLYTATSDSPPAEPRERPGHPVHKLPLELTLKAVRTVIVTVSHPQSGAELAGVRVFASESPASGTGAYGTSDAAGKVTMRLPPGRYPVHADPPSDADVVRTYPPELVVEESPAVQTVAIAMQLGCVVTFRAVDADTGQGVAGANYMMRLRRNEREISTPAYSDTGKVNRPRSNEQGETRMLLDPLQPRRYSISPPQGYDVVDRNDRLGRQLDLAPGKTLTVEFLLRKRPN